MIYLATFHTHFGAVNFVRVLKKLDIAGQMMPTPRVLSASCGVCVRFETSDAQASFLAEDLDSIYQDDGGKYSLYYAAD